MRSGTPAIPVVLDACVLADFIVSDMLLRLAETPALLAPRWSGRILEETRRTHHKLHWPPDVAESWQRVVREHFPEALVEPATGVARGLSNEPKDRHVLAAAIAAGAGQIVTYNLRDFPEAALEPWGVKALHPDEFLLKSWRSDKEAVAARVSAMARRHSMEGLLRKWRRGLPRFAHAVSEQMDEDGKVDEEGMGVKLRIRN